MAKKTSEKTACPITRAFFTENAKPLLASIEGVKVIVGVKEFSTKSFGWYTNEKMTIEIEGVPVKVQAQLNFTIINSKDAE